MPRLNPLQDSTDDSNKLLWSYWPAKIKTKITSWVKSYIQLFAAFPFFPTKTNFCTWRPFVFVSPWTWNKFWFSIFNEPLLFADYRSSCIDGGGSFVLSWSWFVWVSVAWWIFFSEWNQRSFLEKLRTVWDWTGWFLSIDFDPLILLTDYSKLVNSLNQKRELLKHWECCTVQGLGCYWYRVCIFCRCLFCAIKW